MKILQVNVRLTEGGAAQVAWTLQQELEKRGHQVSFLYGYSSRGGYSTKHNASKHIKFTSSINASLNLVLFRLLGHENNLFEKLRANRLVALFRCFDIVHLHVVHSYFVDYKILCRALLKSTVPFVWTMHDQWVMTGRCALPGSCKQWQIGCNPCVNKKAYPPAFFDRAAENFPIKQKILRNLFHAKNSQLVSCAKWLTHELELAHFDNVKTITNSIDQEFLTALQNVEINSVKDNLFVCRDLRDNRKIDWDLLEKISRVSNQTLTIVGDNPPFHLPNVNYVSALNDRFALANIYRSHKRLIFTSKVDHFPLTIAEALASGLEVYALFSKAAMEFADYPKCFIFNSSEELFKELCEKGNSKIVNKYLPSAPNIDFLPEAMTRKYEEIYLDLTNR